MQHQKKILFLFHLLLAYVVCLSQLATNKNGVDGYRAIHWTREDGLTNDKTNVMFKDAKGFLWIGSSERGFCRFDGSNYKRYSPDQKRGSISSNAIYSFKEDSLHNIWIGTSKGISRYDMKA